MDTSSTSTALLSPEEAKILQRARSEASKPVVPVFPSMKLANYGAKIEGVERGHYYTERFDSEAQKNVVTDIGMNPEIVILHRAYTYSYFNEEAERLVAWTSEINGFTSLDMVHLFSNDGQQARIEKQAPYPEFKKYMKANYPKMKFKNVLYVLFEGKPYRMFVSNASVTGIKQGEKKPDYAAPQPLSLLDFASKAGENREAAFFESICTLGSELHDEGVPFYLMTFAVARPNEDLKTAINSYGQLLVELERILKADITRMTTQKEVEVVNAEDLPF